MLFILKITSLFYFDFILKFSIWVCAKTQQRHPEVELSDLCSPALREDTYSSLLPPARHQISTKLQKSDKVRKQKKLGEVRDYNEILMTTISHPAESI